MIRTAGQYDPEDGPAYFIASSQEVTDFAIESGHKYVLIAVNELKAADLPVIDRWFDQGVRVLIDSGVFWLASTHAKAHNMALPEALALPPEQLDEFEALRFKYYDAIARLGDRAWGYIELDQGGKDNKRRLRAKLEADGMRPIPVYHPMSDGWEYFDELASSYDRIAVGNLVQAERHVRVRILTTLHERRQQYPDLWIHLLGYTPSEWMFSVGHKRLSCDSSSWLSGPRFGQTSDAAMLSWQGRMGPEYTYVLGDKVSWQRSFRVSGIISASLQRNWRHATDRFDKLREGTA